MKKISNEVKVGAAALLTLVVFVWLFNFLKGKDLLRSTANYYAVYNRIEGLEESSPVEVNGHKVGIVQSIEFMDPGSGKLLITFSIRKDFKIPRNSVAQIVSVSVLGGMKVQLLYCEGPGFINKGDTIKGRCDESLTEKLANELDPLKDKITNLITALDTVIGSVNEIMNSDFKKNLGGTMANLNGTTRSLERIIGSKEKDLKSTLDNIDKFSGMLADNSESLGKTFKNLGEISDTIAAADLYGTVTRLKSSLERASTLIDNMNNGKGTAGQLLTNDTLYANLSASLESINVLMKDVKENPKKYVHFSLFGKKSTEASQANK
jgi:phospholipid/cholesterol/gamma-HCH transport system substrate-binding protein